MAHEELSELYRALVHSEFQFVPTGEHKIDAVYDFVKSKYDRFCDDSYLCSENCGSQHNQPEWKHRVRVALSELKKNGSDSLTSGTLRGFWVFRSPLVAIDVEIPELKRIESTTQRIVRDTQLARRIKELHDDKCQICGNALTFLNSTTYSEAHHIQPLGHDGPDIQENIIVVCPNHHALCDYGAIKLDVSALRSQDGHIVGKEYIRYHNEKIVGK